MAHEDKSPEPIIWSSTAPKPGADSDLERDLRRYCETDRLTPELAQDVLFWLDLGRGPRDVARWLRHQLEDGQDAARFPTAPDENSLFPQDKHTVEAGQGTGWTRKRKHPTRRLFGRRAVS
jgi:hypothetical protein